MARPQDALSFLQNQISRCARLHGIVSVFSAGRKETSELVTARDGFGYMVAIKSKVLHVEEVHASMYSVLRTCLPLVIQLVSTCHDELSKIHKLHCFFDK